METLNAIYSKTYNFVYLRAKSIFDKEDDVQQLMREVYVKAMEEEVREDRLYSWFGRQVYSLGCGKFRKKKVREADYIELEENQYRASNSVYMEKTVEVICDTLEELPDMYQATLYAFYYDHLKIKDIASMMGYNAKVIVNRLNYVHKYLSKALAFYAEENEVDVEFSVEMLCAALEAWSEKNCLSTTVAQNIYGTICRELSIQSEYECKEGESAGAKKRMVEREGDAMNALLDEIESYQEGKKIAVNPKALIIAGVVLVVVSLVALGFVIGGKNKENPPAEEPPITNEEDPVDDAVEDEGIGMEDETVDESEYILPNSDTVKLTRADLEHLSAAELRLARNELFARYGTIFGPEDLQTYFGSKSWYTPKITFDEFNDTMQMNEVEKANLSLILAIEEEKAE